MLETSPQVAADMAAEGAEHYRRAEELREKARWWDSPAARHGAETGLTASLLHRQPREVLMRDAQLHATLSVAAYMAAAESRALLLEVANSTED